MTLIGYGDPRVVLHASHKTSPFYGSPLADAGLSIFGIKMRALEDAEVSVRKPYMDRHAKEIARLVQRIPVTCTFGTYQANPGNALQNAALELAKHIFDPTILTDIFQIGVRNATRYWYWSPAALAHDITDAISLISNRFNQTVKDVMGSFGVMNVANQMFGPGQPNDGLVPDFSAKLPGAEIVKLVPDTDHAGPVMNVAPFRNFWSRGQRIKDTGERLEQLIDRALVHHD